MVTAPEQNAPWLETLSRRRRDVAYVLLALAGVLLVFAGFLAFRYRAEYAPTALGCAWAAMAFFGIGLWSIFEQPATKSDLNVTRLMALALGGLVGLDLFVV